MKCHMRNTECHCSPSQCVAAPVPPYVHFPARTQRFIVCLALTAIFMAFICYKALERADAYYAEQQLIHQEDGL